MSKLRFYYKCGSYRINTYIFIFFLLNFLNINIYVTNTAFHIYLNLDLNSIYSCFAHLYIYLFIKQQMKEEKNIVTSTFLTVI